ncbi:hypothetical protein PVMG_06072 [Plasmodium vivax Mauritania I]|uniref:Uncharacterized protein n=1 Tax=Plasmodium vivax Mauritania I TaxID=1035515 RepID=A0A0J9T2I4_PLAVI|nr:hypothetical protein PVMG_06072 [Plasmodium vivax Mauritania I]
MYTYFQIFKQHSSNNTYKEIKIRYIIQTDKNDILEKSSKLNALISRLGNKEHGNCCEKTEDYFLHSIDGTNRETLKNIGCSVECGYSFLGAFDGKLLTNLCKYLNFWLDEQKSTHINGISVITDEQWNLIDEIWNDVYANDGSSKCKRQQNIYNTSEKKKHMELFTYCIYRDHIIEMCENTIKHASNIPYFCSSLSEYTDKYYEKFKSDNNCLDNSANDNHYKYYVSQDCSLYDMNKTFPKFNSRYKKIIYENNSRESINECINPIESEGLAAKENRVRAENNPGRDVKNASRVDKNASETEGKDVRSRLNDHQARLGDDQAKLDGDSPEHSQLDFQSLTGDLNDEDAMSAAMHGNTVEAITLPKVSTIGAAVAGSSLFLLMMYKVKKHI